jgi:hypothetical protein
MLTLRGKAPELTSSARPLLLTRAGKGWSKGEDPIQDKRECPPFRLNNEGATMYKLSVYPITANLWRWEIWCGGALLRCGTAPTRVAAERDVNDVVNT